MVIICEEKKQINKSTELNKASEPVSETTKSNKAPAPESVNETTESNEAPESVSETTESNKALEPVSETTESNKAPEPVKKKQAGPLSRKDRDFQNSSDYLGALFLGSLIAQKYNLIVENRNEIIEIFDNFFTLLEKNKNDGDKILEKTSNLLENLGIYKNVFQKVKNFRENNIADKKVIIDSMTNYLDNAYNNKNKVISKGFNVLLSSTKTGFELKKAAFNLMDSYINGYNLDAFNISHNWHGIKELIVEGKENVTELSNYNKEYNILEMQVITSVTKRDFLIHCEVINGLLIATIGIEISGSSLSNCKYYRMILTNISLDNFFEKFNNKEVKNQLFNVLKNLTPEELDSTTKEIAKKIREFFLGKETQK
jgi:hypothetical protein